MIVWMEANVTFDPILEFAYTSGFKHKLQLTYSGRTVAWARLAASADHRNVD